jgi:hypothetical protein
LTDETVRAIESLDRSDLSLQEPSPGPGSQDAE